MAHDYDLALIGCGNMGAALMSGYLVSQHDSRILVIDPDVSRAKDLLPQKADVTFASTLEALFKQSAKIVVLAVKPQSFATLLPELARTTTAEGLHLSIAAGISSYMLKKSMPNARIARCMPNMPALVGAGTSVMWAGPEVAEHDRVSCERLLKSVGTVEWVTSEHQIDASTAISGSGPAYVFAFIEALTQAGVGIGLEPSLAARLALGTVVGAAAMLRQDAASPGDLKAAVRSPAGTTDAALRVLEDNDHLNDLVRRAVAAAYRRTEEMRRS